MQKIKLSIFVLILLTLSTAASAYNFTRDLETGAEGNDVSELQQMLIRQGHLEMPTDAQFGYFGKLTELAVAKWQITNGVIPISGIFGPQSRAVAGASIANPFEDSLSAVSVNANTGGVDLSRRLTNDQILWIADKVQKAGYTNSSSVVATMKVFLGTLNGAETLAWGQSLKSGGFISQKSYDDLSNLLSGTKAIVPTARLTVNGVSDFTVSPGQTYTYTWISTNAKKVSATWETVAGVANRCGGQRGRLTYINTANGSTNGKVPIITEHAGCVWEITLEVESEDGTKATSVANLRVPAASVVPAPVATLRINNSTSYMVDPGESYTYSWSSTNGVSASGTWRTTSGNTAKCGVGGPMNGMNTLNGSMKGVTRITENHAGCVWEVKYEVKNRNGVSVISTATLRASTITAPVTPESTVTLRAPAITTPAVPEPTATIRINNSSDLAVGIGEAYTYSWSSTNGVSASGTWRTIAGDTAKCGASGIMAGMNTLNGSVNGATQITANHAGCVWEVKYEVKNRNGVSATSIANLRARN